MSGRRWIRFLRNELTLLRECFEIQFGRLKSRQRMAKPTFVGSNSIAEGRFRFV